MIRSFLSSKTKQLIVFGGVFVVWFLIVLPLRPVCDDWAYMTSPNYNFSFANLLPGRYWRPFDALFGFALSFCPNLFPALNHFFVILGHTVGGYFAFRIFSKLYKTQTYVVVISSVFYLFAVGSCGTVTSIDGLNQSWSQAFGVMAFWQYVKYRNSRKARPFFLYLTCCVLSTFAKESGIVFGFIIPLSYHVKDVVSFSLEEIKKYCVNVRRDIVIYLLTACAYIVARSLLGKSNSYSDLLLSPTSILMKHIEILSVAFTSIDTLAIFKSPKSPTLLATTIALNIGFLLTVITQIVKNLGSKQEFFKTITLILCVVASLLPNAIANKGSEQNAYVVWFPLVYLIAYTLASFKPTTNKRLIIILFSAFMCASAITFTHKWFCLYRFDKDPEFVLTQIEQDFANSPPPKNVLSICVANGRKGYDHYWQPTTAYYAAGFGIASKKIWNWKYPKSISVKVIGDALTSSPGTMEEAYNYVESCKSDGTFEQYDAVWIIDGYGRYERVK